MRSAIVLADPSFQHDVTSPNPNALTAKLGTYKETKQFFEVDESAVRPNWPYTFQVDFVERRFNLAARTLREMEEWMRVFNLIVTLNKIGFSVAEKNPYTFEAQQQEINSSGQKPSLQATLTMGKMGIHESLNNT